MGAAVDVIEPGGDPAEESFTGWPVRVRSYNPPWARDWPPLITVFVEPPTPDDSPDEKSINLSPDGAIMLAVQLIAVAHRVREIERERATD